MALPSGLARYLPAIAWSESDWQTGAGSPAVFRGNFPPEADLPMA